MTEHTPGPWRSRPHLGGYWIDAPETRDGMWGPQSVATVGEQADAYLITAAPALLRVVKAFLNGDASVSHMSVCYAEARRAIAEAEGKL